jgi:hypothetical protein
MSDGMLAAPSLSKRLEGQLTPSTAVDERLSFSRTSTALIRGYDFSNEDNIGSVFLSLKIRDHNSLRPITLAISRKLKKGNNITLCSAYIQVDS